ncbi:MAG: hypothetical protein IJZ75_06010 [Clostridia bacterium]|nr:hypothetical protein [Clostridia bacterium]
MKRVISVILIVFNIICLSGCSSSMHGDVKYPPDKTDNAIVYKDVKYNYLDEIDFDIHNTEEDIKLGYQNTFKGYRGFFSETTENPIYIFISRRVGDFDMALYIREDYDYKSKTLVLENTTDQIVYSDAFIKMDSELEPVSWDEYFYISLYFEDCPRLKIKEDIYFTEGIYYYINNGQRYMLSDQLLDILRKNNIII